MARILSIATTVLLAGCGTPGFSGRGTPVPDAGGPVSVSRQDWTSSLCSKRCTGRCPNGTCLGITITTSGLPAAPTREKK